MSFSKKLKELRAQAKLSQSQLANDIKVSQSSIGYWERGEKVPSVDMIQKLADYFQVSADYLIDTEYVTKKKSEVDKLLNESKVIKLVGEVFDPGAEAMLSAYTFLNETGRFVAFERVLELTEIPKYRNEDTPD